jgi:hypothetical protein
VSETTRPERPTQYNPPARAPRGPNAKAFLICYRKLTTKAGRSPCFEVTEWCDLAEALAAHSMGKCARQCRGDHVVVFADADGRPRAKRLPQHPHQTRRNHD